VQLLAYQHGVAAILRQIKRDAEWCAGHKEWALPHGRKDDPCFEMAEFRSAVSAVLGGGAPPLPSIPHSEAADGGGAQARPTLRRPASDDLVKVIQTRLKLDADGNFGPATEAAVRALQRERGFVPDGIVGPKTWALLDQLA